MSHCDIEDLLAERGIVVSQESIHLWCNKFGPKYASRLRRRYQGYGDTFFLDEVLVKIQGKQRPVPTKKAVHIVFLDFPGTQPLALSLAYDVAWSVQWIDDSW